MGCGCGKGKNQKKWEVTAPGHSPQIFTSLAEANQAKRKIGASATLKPVKTG